MAPRASARAQTQPRSGLAARTVRTQGVSVRLLPDRPWSATYGNVRVKPSVVNGAYHYFLDSDRAEGQVRVRNDLPLNVLAIVKVAEEVHEAFVKGKL